MKFVLAMAVRETRASWQRLLFFFICIAIGVAAIVALRSVIQNVRAVFTQEARGLIAADVTISTRREWTPAARQTIDRHLQLVGADTQTESVETPTMVRAADAASSTVRMVELRAVGPEFPLYGTVGLEGGQAYSHDLLRNAGALVRPELLTALDVRVGDRLAIGKATFTIRGVITTEPGRNMGNFSLGPRVLIDFADVGATGLIGFGSQVRRMILVRVDESRADALVRALREEFSDEFVNARSFRATDDEIGEDFERAENYLSMVGLVIVILGGIAVSSVTRVFILQKSAASPCSSAWGRGAPRSSRSICCRCSHSGWLAACSGSCWRAARLRRFRCFFPPERRFWPTSNTVSRRARWRRASASAHSCRCCFRSCRSCRCGWSSRRCCCATSRRRRRHSTGCAGRRWRSSRPRSSR